VEDRGGENAQKSRDPCAAQVLDIIGFNYC
jgi:hypothetical protein